MRWFTFLRYASVFGDQSNLLSMMVPRYLQFVTISTGQVGDLGFVTGRAQPRLRQQHDVDVVVLNEGGYVGPPPGSAGGSSIKEADTVCFRLRKN